MRFNLILFRCSQNSTRSTFFSESLDRNAHAAQESLLASLCNWSPAADTLLGSCPFMCLAFLLPASTGSLSIFYFGWLGRGRESLVSQVTEIFLNILSPALTNWHLFTEDNTFSAVCSTSHYYCVMTREGWSSSVECGQLTLKSFSRILNDLLLSLFILLTSMPYLIPSPSPFSFIFGTYSYLQTEPSNPILNILPMLHILDSSPDRSFSIMTLYLDLSHMHAWGTISNFATSSLFICPLYKFWSLHCCPLFPRLANLFACICFP